MELKKSVNLGGEFAKVNVDFKDGDLITIADGGQVVAGEFGDQYIFKVNTPGGAKVMTFNKTSRNNLIDAYGSITDDWIGKKAKVAVVKQMVGDKLRNVVYLMGEEYAMNDDGSFTKGKNADEANFEKEFSGEEIPL